MPNYHSICHLYRLIFHLLIKEGTSLNPDGLLLIRQLIRKVSAASVSINKDLEAYGVNSIGTGLLSQRSSSQMRRLISRRQYFHCTRRRMKGKQATGGEFLPTWSLVADGSGQAELKISEKSEGERATGPPADQPPTKTHRKVERKAEADSELPGDFCAPAWNLPSEGVFLVEIGHRPQEVPAEPKREPAGRGPPQNEGQCRFSGTEVEQRSCGSSAWLNPQVSSSFVWTKPFSLFLEM